MIEIKLKELKETFLKLVPKDCFCSLRYVNEASETLHVRQDILQPISTSVDQGIMISVYSNKGMGYGATSDLTEAGIKKAISAALEWAALSSKYPLFDFKKLTEEPPVGSYGSHVSTLWDSVSAKEKVDLLLEISKQLKIADSVVNWETMLWHINRTNYYVTTDGGDVLQQSSLVIPDISVTANQGSETQTRTLDGMMALSQQGGFEVLSTINFKERAKEVAEDAVELLHADECPSDTMDLVLDPTQMMLQIHESIGHPLEIDRILGDERNYAGTSFVKPDMVGSYQYGSELLNITFDPRVKNQLASYSYDDDGVEAEKEYIIKNGILIRGLGSSISQSRSDLAGVANSRACNWNRPPIDRMANLNLEPGKSTKEEIINSVEKGVFMTANKSWSIDDSRNKFQFGCEKGILIENGKLTKTVKNPNYRGISATFWRNLQMVGNRSTFIKMGTPFCGKGEPNQVIPVGHASPMAKFANVEVFS